MESRFAERCLVLNDVCEGLVARLSFMQATLRDPATVPSSVVNNDWSKLRAKLVDKFPEIPDVTKVQHYDSFQSSAGTTQVELFTAFTTLVDAHELHGAAFELLVQVPRSLRVLKVGSNPALTRAYMRLLVHYVQLHFYLAQFPEVKTLLSLYGLAFKVANSGRTADQYQEVAAFVNCYEAPTLMRTLSDELRGCQELAHLLETLLPHVNDSIVAAFSAEQSVHTSKKSMLDPLQRVASLALPTVTKLKETPVRAAAVVGGDGGGGGGEPDDRMLHTEVLCAAEYVRWVVYSVFLFPQLAMSNDVLGVFHLAASDNLYLPVYRDVVFPVHEEMEKLAAWFPSKVSKQFTVPKGFNLKKIAKDLAKEATSTCGKKHKERLSYVTAEIEKLNSLLEIIPGLCGPKFPVVLAAAAMAQTEILWLFRHAANVQTKNRAIDMADFSVELLPEAIHQLERLVDKMRANEIVIQEYYCEYLRTTHATALAASMPALADGLRNQFGTKIDELVGALTAKLETPVGQPPALDEFEAFRLNWMRVECVLFAQAPLAGVGTDTATLAAAQPALSRMNLVMEHTRYADSTQAMLERYGQVSGTWWFKNEFRAVFNAALNSSGHGSRACIAFLKVLSSTVCALSAYCPEEHEALRAAATARAQELLQAIVAKVEALVEVMLESVNTLGAQVEPAEAARKSDRARELAQSSRRNMKLPTRTAKPGEESFPAARPQIQRFVDAEATLAEILHAVAQAGTIPVFHVQFTPREWVRDFLDAFLKQTVQRIVQLDKDFPTQILTKLTHVFRALQKSLAFVEIDVPGAVRRALFGGSYDAATFDFLQPPQDPLDPSSVVVRAAQWYVQLVDGLAAEANADVVVYSALDHAFVVGGPSRRGGSQAAAVTKARHLDRLEFRALATVLGAHGMRVIDAALVRYVAGHARALASFVDSHGPALDELSRSTVGDGWQQHVATLAGLDAVHRTLVSIGMALAAREIMALGMRDVAKELVPFAVETAELLTLGAPLTKPGGGEELEDAQRLCRACGVVEGCGDVVLWTELRAVLDADRLCRLPAALAAALMCDAWKTTEYLTDVDAFKSNEHVVALAANALFACAASPAPPPTALGEDFVRIAASITLKMRLGTSQTLSPQLSVYFTFLEKFADMGPTERSTLEVYLPYSVVHAARMDLALRGAGAGAGAGASIEAEEAADT